MRLGSSEEPLSQGEDALSRLLVQRDDELFKEEESKRHTVYQNNNIEEYANEDVQKIIDREIWITF